MNADLFVLNPRVFSLASQRTKDQQIWLILHNDACSSPHSLSLTSSNGGILFKAYLPPLTTIIPLIRICVQHLEFYFGSRPERPVPTAQPSPRQPAIYPVMPLGPTNAGAWQTGGRCQLVLTVGAEMKEPGWQKRADRIETCRVLLCV